MGKVFRNLHWALRNEPITDVERFAFNLALRHLKEGKPMLAQEDLAWLERRLRRAPEITTSVYRGKA
jgi:hypothetical protein